MPSRRPLVAGSGERWRPPPATAFLAGSWPLRRCYLDKIAVD